jgi:peptidyl-prolyl cis-trans isomerase A (cyclophilin A)
MNLRGPFSVARSVGAVALLLAGVATVAAFAPVRVSSIGAPVRLVIETSAGPITVEVDSARAPITVANFLRYVDSGAYSGGRFHRTVTMDNQPRDSVKIEVIQAGPNQARTGARFPAIVLERTSETGLRHRDGTLSMARAGPNTATSDFFICVGDQPALDFAGKRNADGQGFAAFGQVTSGMDVVRAIQKSPVSAQSLTPPVQIVRIRRESR